MRRAVTAEFLGALLLTAAVVGSGIMGERLAAGNSGVALGFGQWLSESVATAGLIVVAFSSPTITAAAWRVSAWIGAAYWFTASTFANPAITLGRSLTDSFTGIRPADAPGFIAAQLVGAVAGAMVLRLLTDRKIAV